MTVQNSSHHADFFSTLRGHEYDSHISKSDTAGGEYDNIFLNKCIELTFSSSSLDQMLFEFTQYF
jgi:hypothetical protein